jgi:hypothetical protein
MAVFCDKRAEDYMYVLQSMPSDCESHRVSINQFLQSTAKKRPGRPIPPGQNTKKCKYKQGLSERI